MHSESENALLVTAAAGNKVWIGGTDAASEDTWKWDSTGTPLWYTNWYSGQPDDAGGNEDCMEFNYRSSGKWNDATCTIKLKYVCQFPTPPQPPPVYTLMHGALSWGNAYTTCVRAGLRLASVHSAAENALLVTAAAGNEVWIGGTDAASEGTWKWSPSGAPLSYTNWIGGEPNDWGGQDCLQVYSSGKWDDYFCSAKKFHVCTTACGTSQPLQVSRSNTASTPSLLSDTPCCCSSRVSSHLCASAPHPLVSTQCEACDNLSCAAGYYRGGTGCTATVYGLTASASAVITALSVP